MAKLERRTQEAIHTLIREPSLHEESLLKIAADGLIGCHAGQRLSAQKGESDDIVGAMRAQGKGGPAEDDASDED